MKCSMSVAKGRGNQKHNDRTQPVRPKNINVARTHLNVEIVNEPIRDAYKRIFDDAVKEYNEKQIKRKRPDRCIKDYYQKVVHDKKTQTFHELVIQVGNKQYHPDNIELTNAIYKDFVKEFIENNPKMAVIGAYIHNDESTPHLHLDYIPFADGAKNGVKRRVSNDKALLQMGYKNWANWREEQLDTLVDVAKKYDIEREIKGSSHEHKSVTDFKIAIEDARNELASMDYEPIQMERSRIRKGKVVIEEDELEKIDKKRKETEYVYAKTAQLEQVTKSINKRAIEREKLANEGLSRAKDQYDQMRKEAYQSAKILVTQEMEAKRTELEAREKAVQKAENDIESVKNDYEKQISDEKEKNIMLSRDLSKVIGQLKAENALSEHQKRTMDAQFDIISAKNDEIKRLKGQNKDLNHELSKMQHDNEMLQRDIMELKQSISALKSEIRRLVDVIKGMVNMVKDVIYGWTITDKELEQDINAVQDYAQFALPEYHEQINDEDTMPESYDAYQKHLEAQEKKKAFEKSIDDDFGLF